MKRVQPWPASPLSTLHIGERDTRDTQGTPDTTDAVLGAAGDKFEDRIGSMDEEAGSAALTNGLWVAGLLLAGYKGNAARVVRVFTQQADPASGLATRRHASSHVTDPGLLCPSMRA